MEEGEERERVVKSLREVREAEKNKSNEGGGVRKGRMERERESDFGERCLCYGIMLVPRVRLPGKNPC